MILLAWRGQQLWHCFGLLLHCFRCPITMQWLMATTAAAAASSIDYTLLLSVQRRAGQQAAGSVSTSSRRFCKQRAGCCHVAAGSLPLCRGKAHGCSLWERRQRQSYGQAPAKALHAAGCRCCSGSQRPAAVAATMAERLRARCSPGPEHITASGRMAECCFAAWPLLRAVRECQAALLLLRSTRRPWHGAAAAPPGRGGQFAPRPAPRRRLMRACSCLQLAEVRAGADRDVFVHCTRQAPLP
jgi:hypothetical protein